MKTNKFTYAVVLGTAMTLGVACSKNKAKAPGVVPPAPAVVATPTPAPAKKDTRSFIETASYAYSLDKQLRSNGYYNLGPIGNSGAKNTFSTQYVHDVLPSGITTGFIEISNVIVAKPGDLAPKDSVVFRFQFEYDSKPTDNGGKPDMNSGSLLYQGKPVGRMTRSYVKSTDVVDSKTNQFVTKSVYTITELCSSVGNSCFIRHSNEETLSGKINKDMFEFLGQSELDFVKKGVWSMQREEGTKILAAWNQIRDLQNQARAQHQEASKEASKFAKEITSLNALKSVLESKRTQMLQAIDRLNKARVNQGTTHFQDTLANLQADELLAGLKVVQAKLDETGYSINKHRYYYERYNISR